MKNLQRIACGSALLSVLSVFHAAPAPAAPAATPTKVTDPGTEGDGDFKIGPNFANDPLTKARPGIARGTVSAFTMNSEDSKIYPGLKGAYKRNVWVYVPANYVAGTPAPFIVVMDAMARGPLTGTLDNLIADKKLPAMVAIFISSGGGDGQGSERGLEYDTVSDKYTAFIETEVLPRITKDYKVTFTTDPEGRATMGGSSGGSCAFTMAWFHPELYRKVLTYSGTYVNQQSPKNPQSPHGAWEYHENLIPKSEPKPIRVYLEVGSKDNGATAPESGFHNWVLANQHMAAVLKAKGYHYHLDYAEGAGHVDGKAVSQTLPAAMLWLWRGYPIN